MKLETERSVPMHSTTSFAPQGKAILANAQFRRFAVFTVVLLIAFSWPLLKLVRFAAHAELYSHILLVPFISGYLWWIKRNEPKPEFRSSASAAMVSFAAAASVLVIYWVAVRKGWQTEIPDTLAATTLSFLLFWLGGAFLFLGTPFLRSIAFPVGFLLFSVPFTMPVRRAIEFFCQHGSAHITYWMLTVAGMPVLKDGTFFQLPGVPLNVARECSGIHASWILFITGVVASYMFLEKPRNRWIFILATIPLGLLRNGFRIFVISELCVHIGPQMIDSPIHRQGGPLFFVLSLIPLFLLLLYLIKRESRKANATDVRTKE